MASLIKKIDDDFIEEWREMSDNLNTEKKDTHKIPEEAEKWKTDRKKSNWNVILTPLAYDHSSAYMALKSSIELQFCSCKKLYSLWKILSKIPDL